MDEDGFLTHLQCDVELSLTGTDPDVNKRAALELRKLADRIENDEFEDGWHAFVEAIGMAMGKVYIDYSGSPAEEFDT
jgi:hypothetical protein